MIFTCAAAVDRIGEGFLFQLGRMAAGLVVPAVLLVILAAYCVFSYLLHLTRKGKR